MIHLRPGSVKLCTSPGNGNMIKCSSDWLSTARKCRRKKHHETLQSSTPSSSQQIKYNWDFIDVCFISWEILVQDVWLNWDRKASHTHTHSDRLQKPVIPELLIICSSHGTEGGRSLAAASFYLIRMKTLTQRLPNDSVSCKCCNVHENTRRAGSRLWVDAVCIVFFKLNED